VSSSNYGVWGQSSNFRGVTGRTSRTDNNYGLYTPDNLFSLNVNLAGAIMLVNWSQIVSTNFATCAMAQSGLTTMRSMTNVTDRF
jgi:hypothetical protein